MKFLFWVAIICSLLGLLVSATWLILSHAFAVGSVVTTVVCTINVAVSSAVLTGTTMLRRGDNGF